jgi:sugar transferase (PEP-CTERM/EpsH1 system associated)
MLDPSRPNVLYLVHRTPYPPDKGDRIRAFHLLRHLSRRANVHLACLADEPASAETIAALERYCERIMVVPVASRARWLRALYCLGRGRTITEGAFHSPMLNAVVREWARGVDFTAAVASASSMAPYLRTPELRGARAVVDLVDVDSQKWLDYAAAGGRRSPAAWIYRTEGRRLRKFEQSLLKWARAVTLVSDAETALFTQFCPLPGVHTVTNGVDLDYFTPRISDKEEEGCVFVGALDYRPNVDGVDWFCREVWPKIHDRRPKTRLRLVGRRPTATVRRLASVAGVDVIGQVPDIRPHLTGAAVAVAPLRIARGLQNKVLEAMAMGKAVVASPQAMQGLKERLDAPVLCAADGEEWVTLVLRLLEQVDLRNHLGALGRQYVETHYDWERCLAPFDALLGLPEDGAAADGSLQDSAVQCVVPGLQ